MFKIKVSIQRRAKSSPGNGTETLTLSLSFCSTSNATAACVTVDPECIFQTALSLKSETDYTDRSSIQNSVPADDINVFGCG
jgi:hypothetical protein